MALTLSGIAPRMTSFACRNVDALRSSGAASTSWIAAKKRGVAIKASEILVQGLVILASFLVGSALCLVCSEARLKAFENEAVRKGAAYYNDTTGEFTWKKFISIDPSQLTQPPSLFDT